MPDWTDEKRRKGGLTPFIGHRTANPNMPQGSSFIINGHEIPMGASPTPEPEKPMTLPEPSPMPDEGTAAFDDTGNLYVNGHPSARASREETGHFFPELLPDGVEFAPLEFGLPSTPSADGVELDSLLKEIYVDGSEADVDEDTEIYLDAQEKSEFMVDPEWNPVFVGEGSANMDVHKQMAMDRVNEWSSRVLSIGRVSVTRKAGRNPSMRALVVAGDLNGRVGVGFGKHKTVRGAIDNGLKLAVRDMVWIPLYEGRTLYHDIVGMHNKCKVLIRAAPAGAGNVAGKGVRSILDVMGIRDSTTKVFGRQNSYSIVLAALKAFENYESAQMVALKRGKRLMDVNKVMRDHNTTND